MQNIRDIIGRMPVSEQVKEHALAVYRLIAEAESAVHGRPVEEIHFHEVGSMDAVADVTLFCMLMEEIAPEQVIVSPVHVGSGKVRCAHGILPVPAPATALLLKDVPIYGGSVKGELCTPTGAALLKHFASSFGDMPVMRTEKIGYGMGKKDFPAANCVRALLGNAGDHRDAVVELVCNIDDMTGEEIGFATERLFEAGALEVYTQSAYMKKNRPGILLSAMCRANDREHVLETMFRHTSTIGVREHISNRYILKREIKEVETPYGTVRKKVSEGYGVTKEKWEFDDLAKIAKETGKSLSELKKDLPV